MKIYKDKSISSLFLVLVLYVGLSLISYKSNAQQATRSGSFAGYPTPKKSGRMLFYIQRSINTNTVVYEANVLPTGKLDTEKPINVFWRNYEQKHNNIQDLNFLEKKIGYGVKATKEYEETPRFIFVADNSRGFYVCKNETDKSYYAKMKINGQWAVLEKVYVKAKNTYLLPKVEWIHVYGKSIASGKKIVEEIIL